MPCLCWEQLNNPEFNSIEFDGIKLRAGLNSFSLTPKHWIAEKWAASLPEQGTMAAPLP